MGDEIRNSSTIKRRTLWLVFITILGGLSVLAYAKRFGSNEPPAVVNINDQSFRPETLIITNGQEVIFQNVGNQVHWPASNLHPTHGIYPEFDPQRSIEPGGAWSFRFTKTGKWRYHDHLFPSVRGTIEVQ